MLVSYETDSRLLEALPSVFDEYAEWYGGVLRRMFYPEDSRNNEPLSPPSHYKNWAEQVRSAEILSNSFMDDLQKRHEKLIEAGQDLLEKSKSEGAQKPPQERFERFSALYDELMNALRSAQYDCMLADSGVDSLSGLRSSHAMIVDMERELERRARRGKPFCLALARIDDYEKLRQSTDEQGHKDIMLKISAMIKKCLRNFDDAYRSGDGEFIMSLKQSEQAGGLAAIERLRGYLAEADIRLTDPQGQDYKLTMSYCVAEPQPGDTLEKLLSDMRADLGSFEGGNTSLEYHEVSELQRFLKNAQD